MVQVTISLFEIRRVNTIKRAGGRRKERVEKLKAGRAPHHVNINALSPSDWSYIYGLYFTDGNVCRGYHVRFCLQGNEEQIAQRVAEMIQRIGLKPTISRHSKKDMIVVQSYSKQLADFLPDKEKILNNMALADEYMRKNNLTLDLSFCAGLIDGDGMCKAYEVKSRSKRRGSFGTINVEWTFSQTKFPFLRKVFRDFVEFLAPKSTTEIYARGRVEGVRVNTRGRKALLESGLANRSWKASEFGELFSRLVGKHKRKRAEWAKRIDNSGMRIKVVSRELDIPYKTLITWKQRGKLRTTLVYEGGGMGKLIVPRDEVDRIRGLVLTRRSAGEFPPQ